MPPKRESPEPADGIVGHGKVDINEQPEILVTSEEAADAARENKPGANVRVVRAIRAIGAVKRES
jgi:hypothetical protein